MTSFIRALLAALRCHHVDTRLDPVLVLDWRSVATGHGEEAHITTLREFRASIVSAIDLLREDLIARVVVWP